jgi:excisionase family DNA binding protein
MTNTKGMENRRPVQKKANYLISINPLELQEIVNSMVNVAMNKYLQKNNQDDEKYLTRQQTCKLLKISLPTLHNLHKKGSLKAHKINSRVRYIQSEVQKFIKQS